MGERESVCVHARVHARERVLLFDINFGAYVVLGKKKSVFMNMENHITS